MASHHTDRSPMSDAAPQRDFTYVDTDAGLAAVVADMWRHERSGPGFRCCLDTEADSLHHYAEKLCLIQLAYDDKYALIDPLAINDMGPFLEVLDAGEVWFHGADYDLTLFRKTYDWIPERVRDTQIAARLTGSKQFGLAALVEQHFGKTLSKASQKADWSRRPLPPVMLAYAVDDVRYLLPLADLLTATLAEKDRMAWFYQSCVALRRQVTERSSAAKEDPWRVQGSGRLHPRGLAALKAMWEWRDEQAAKRDVPCFRIFSNKQMVEAVLCYEQGRILPPPNGWRPRWKQEYFDLLQRVTDTDDDDLPRRLRTQGGRLSEKAREHLEKLCGEREKVAQGLDLEPSLLGSRSTLELVVGQADGVSELMEWQAELLKEPIDVVRQELGFTSP